MDQDTDVADNAYVIYKNIVNLMRHCTVNIDRYSSARGCMVKESMSVIDAYDYWGLECQRNDVDNSQFISGYRGIISALMLVHKAILAELQNLGDLLNQLPKSPVVEPLQELMPVTYEADTMQEPGAPAQPAEPLPSELDESETEGEPDGDEAEPEIVDAESEQDDDYVQSEDEDELP